VLVEGLGDCFAKIDASNCFLIDLLYLLWQQIQVILNFLSMRSTLFTLKQLVQLKIAHWVVPQRIRLNIL
jgi:hypothetical protein